MNTYMFIVRRWDYIFETQKIDKSGDSEKVKIDFGRAVINHGFRPSSSWMVSVYDMETLRKLNC